MIIGRKMETKFYNWGFAASAITATPNIEQFSMIPQGAADEQRVGDSIKLKKVTCRFQAVGGDIYNTMRVIIFRYKSDSATAPVVGDVFNTTAPGSEYVLCPVPGLEHNEKVQILYDKVVTLPQTNYYTTSSQITNSSNSVKTWKVTLFGKRLGARTVRYNPGATSGYGQLYVVSVSDSAILPNPTLYFNAQIEYTDS